MRSYLHTVGLVAALCLVLLSMFWLVGCNSPSTPSAVVTPTPTPAAVVSPSPAPTPTPIASYDFSIQQDPAIVYASTWSKYTWETHGRVRVENTGDLLGHLVIVQLDVPSMKQDRDWRYEEIRDFAGSDEIAVGKTLQIPFKLFFNWDRGFPQEVIASAWVRDEHGIMHKYVFPWTVGE